MGDLPKDKGWGALAFPPLPLGEGPWGEGAKKAVGERARYSSSVRSFSRTEKSSNVVTSPATEPLVAISRNKRRMIFPERVFGRASAKRRSSGRASAPISFAT